MKTERRQAIKDAIVYGNNTDFEDVAKVWVCPSESGIGEYIPGVFVRWRRPWHRFFRKTALAITFTRNAHYPFNRKVELKNVRPDRIWHRSESFSEEHEFVLGEGVDAK